MKNIALLLSKIFSTINFSIPFTPSPFPARNMINDQNCDVPSTQPASNPTENVEEVHSVQDADETETAPIYNHWNGDLPEAQGIIAEKFA